MRVAVIGGSAIDEQTYERAVLVGQSHGDRGHAVVCGAAVIAIDGSTGTLSEIGHALDFGRPVAGLDTHDIDDAGFEAVETPQGAVEHVERAASDRDRDSNAD